MELLTRDIWFVVNAEQFLAGDILCFPEKLYTSLEEAKQNCGHGECPVLLLSIINSVNAYQLIKKPKEQELEDIPSYGEHITIETFIEWCEDGYVTEDDGIGYYATKTKMSEIGVSPFYMKKGIIEDGWTHVVWFNK